MLTHAEQGVQLVLLGNKTDREEKEVETEEASAFASENGMMFFEVSAKTSDQVSRAFNQVGSQLLTTNNQTGEHHINIINKKSHTKPCSC